MEFLEGLQRRPLNISDPKNTKPLALFLGQGPNGLEVAVFESATQPTASNLRAIWNSRLAGRATPLLTVVLFGQSAALCGPNGDPPPTFTSLARDRVERICRAALAEPDRNAALRFLSSVIPEADSPLAGLRNEGLFATHELQRGLPLKVERWAEARAISQPLLKLRSEKLLEGLGYSIESSVGPYSILRGGEHRRHLLGPGRIT
jgi:hypothetical protein